MTNTAYQNACLKLDKWIDPPCLDAHKAAELSRDLLGVRKAITDLSDELRRLKIGRAVKQNVSSLANLSKGRKPKDCSSPEQVAEAICSASGTFDVYRTKHGIKWHPRGLPAPANAEFIGRYNAESADYREVLADLRA